MVRVSRTLLRDAGTGISKTLSEILVCPLSKQPLRVCEESNSLISDSICVSYPIVDGIPCLVPSDGKIIETDEPTTHDGAIDSTTHEDLSRNLKAIETAIGCIRQTQLCVGHSKSSLSSNNPLKPRKIAEHLSRLLLANTPNLLLFKDSATTTKYLKPSFSLSSLPTPMVFINKFVYFICCFIGLGGRSNRIKDSSSFDPARTQKLCGPDEDPTVDGIDEGLEEGGGGGAAVCCVCLLRLKEEPETRVLPCTHEFHRICIDRWFSACRCRKTCPVCRFPVEDGRRKYESEEMVEEMVTWFSSFHASGF